MRIITLLVIDYVHELRKINPNCGSEPDRTFALPHLDCEKSILKEDISEFHNIFVLRDAVF